MRTLRRHFDPVALTVCPLCNEAEEDCSHIFFQCLLAQAAWRAWATKTPPRTRSFGDPSVVVSSAERWIGYVSSPLYGRCGYIETRPFSGVDSPQTRRSCTTRGGLLYPGIKEASAPCMMYPCNLPCILSSFQ